MEESLEKLIKISDWFWFMSDDLKLVGDDESLYSLEEEDDEETRDAIRSYIG